MRNFESSSDWELRNPITGLAGCWERATTGHAAALDIDEPRR
jgi:hypothetical protein